MSALRWKKLRGNLHNSAVLQPLVCSIPSKIPRQKRVARLIQRVLADAINRKNLPVTITAVHVSACLRHAQVFVLPFGGKESEADAFLALLQEQTSFLRQEVGHGVSLRYVPELRFLLDETFARSARIEALLKALPPSQNC
ncbi:MAG: 30S ribosome-binding factor RbfA [Holosporales bacterium]|nr:30S ribosome-binding factor RbfA [Holosporales bacterium]